MFRPFILCSVLLLTACPVQKPATDVAPDDTAQDTDSPGIQPGVLPDIPTQAGVAYVVHYGSEDLQIIRTSGASPRKPDTVDMGEVSHDVAVDSVNDLLAVAHDVGRSVSLFQVHRPDSNSFQAPTLLATIDFGDWAPRFLRFDPWEKQLFVFVTSTDASSMEMRVVDVSNPSTPLAIDGGSHTVPMSSSMDIDPVRNLLFLFFGVDDTLRTYDITGGGLEEISSLDLRTFFPEENTWSFAARNLTADPWSNRLYAARAQGTLTEMIVLEYDGVLPGAGQTWAELADPSFQVLADPYDVTVDYETRPYLLNAFTPLIDMENNSVFFLAQAWYDNYNAIADLLVPMFSETLAVGPGCNAYAGTGCWGLNFYDHNASQFLAYTDGAACVDRAHKVVVTTTIDLLGGDPGFALLYQYDDDLVMTPWLTEDGNTLGVGVGAIGAACH
jgi:hypothetical protein